MIMMIGIVLILFGALRLIPSIKQNSTIKNARKSWKSAEGTFISMRKYRSNITSRSPSRLRSSESTTQITRYYPVFEYFVNSRQYKIESTDGSMMPDTYKSGDKTNVLYNPENPKSAVLESDINPSWIFIVAIILIFFGICLIVVGVLKG